MDKKKYVYSISFIVLILDQIIKLIITNTMTLHQEITIIPNFFSLYYVENPGAAFSILGNQTLSLGMIVGGTIGNLFDRILYKVVIDYLAFDIFSYSFPVFNLADIAITTGAALLLLSYILENKKK